MHGHTDLQLLVVRASFFSPCFTCSLSCSERLRTCLLTPFVFLCQSETVSHVMVLAQFCDMAQMIRRLGEGPEMLKTRASVFRQIKPVPAPRPTQRENKRASLFLDTEGEIQAGSPRCHVAEHSALSLFSFCLCRACRRTCPLPADVRSGICCCSCFQCAKTSHGAIMTGFGVKSSEREQQQDGSRKASTGISCFPAPPLPSQKIFSHERIIELSDLSLFSPILKTFLKDPFPSL